MKINLPKLKKTRNEKEIKTLWTITKQFFSLRIVRWGLLILVLIIITPFIFFIFRKPVPQKNINYGVNFSPKYAEEMGLDWQETYLAILDELGAKNIRLVAYWDEIERINNVFDYSVIEWQLEEAEKRNINVILAVGKKVPRWPECFEPEWWKSIESEDVRDYELMNFVETTVNELSAYSSIKVWQVENEPFFPFGICEKTSIETVRKEVDLVRTLDTRPILIQDSGEGGYWFITYSLGDYMGISMYRKIWYDFWGIFLGKSIYFQYPLASWTYKIKADMFGIPYQNIIVTELQAEPWGPTINSELSPEERDKTMSSTDFLNTISYAQSAGFKDLYFWGAEWWYWSKVKDNNPFYWDTAKSIIQQPRADY